MTHHGALTVRADKVKRRMGQPNLRLLHIVWIHATDQIRAAECQQIFTIRFHQVSVELFSCHIHKIRMLPESIPDVKNEDFMFAEPATG